MLILEKVKNANKSQQNKNGLQLHNLNYLP